ncbi:alpha/beta fold hydrolase [Membranicola marinus]|uniref:Alpha/beta fold hydrolase n=1 Tax=Membranihabitans marinus TaxID=1227546 RepID=A0A953HUP8_9BACT|nr:alpha/beta fold hydrolase [Membranihabitans marinus]MBY5956836.1 alpha/beta fold hydrolase [Membranihabitans marinus]
MPYLIKSKYKPPYLFRNGHTATMYSGVIKKTIAPKYEQETWELADGDFLQVDVRIRNTDRAVILCHGLEGDSQSGYINTAADYFIRRGYSVFAWNNRSCGGTINRLPQLYHHGSAEDLETVVQRVSDRRFNNIYLLGHSLGGAQILSYLGRHTIPDTVRAAVAVSTPIQLKSSAQMINKGLSRIYARRFIKSYKKKVLTKAQTFPHLLDIHQVRRIKRFEDIANSFMVPVHGFTDLEDYYQRASPESTLDCIRTPALVLNAWNDPMLGTQDYPVEMAHYHSSLFLETPHHGGHCAFPMPHSYHSYAEVRAYAFFEEISSI